MNPNVVVSFSKNPLRVWSSNNNTNNNNNTNYNTTLQVFQLKEEEGQKDCFIPLVNALFPHLDESRFMHWLQSSISTASIHPHERFILFRQFDKAIPLCQDDDDNALAATLATLSCTTTNTDVIYSLIKKQIRQWSMDRISIPFAWKILAGIDSHPDPLIRLAIRLNFKYSSPPHPTFQDRLLKSINSPEDREEEDSSEMISYHHTIKNLIKHALGIQQNSLAGLLAGLSSLKDRLEVAERLSADDSIVNLLRRQIGEEGGGGGSRPSSTTEFLYQLLKEEKEEKGQDIFANHLEASLYQEINGEELDNLLGHLPGPEGLGKRAGLHWLYLHKPNGHERLMADIMDAEFALLPQEQTIRLEMAEYLADNFALLVRDLPPNQRLAHLHTTLK